MGLAHSDVDLKVSLSESGKKRAQLMDCLRGAHSLLEGQSDQLQKRQNQLEESKAKIELLSWNQKQLENSISQLEEEKDLFQASYCEDQRNQAELQEKILHLEKEMAKTKCSLEQINQGRPSVLLYPTYTFPLTGIGEDLLKQGKATLIRKLQTAQDTAHVYQDWAVGVGAERDKVFEELKTFREAQRSALMKTNESNQRLTDSLRAQGSLHNEMNELRISCSEATLERDLLSSKVLRLDGAVEDLKAKLVGAVADKDRFFKEKLDLHQRVQLLSLELERAQRGREGFDEQVASLHVELVSSKSQANRKDQEKVLLKEELATIKQVNERVSSEMAEIQKKLVSCQEQLHQLEAEKKILNNRMEALEAERIQLISEKEMLVTAVTTSNQSQDSELLTCKADCEALRVSQAQLNEQNKWLEAQLQQKAEELAAVTLEQQQVTLHWKEKWQEAAVALKAKANEVHLATVTCKRSNAKQESLSVVRVELDACKQELELEKSTRCKLQRQVQALQSASHQLHQPSQADQGTMFHKRSGSAVMERTLVNRKLDVTETQMEGIWCHRKGSSSYSWKARMLHFQDIF
ncbi:cingulin [Callorhinchus milii]|uniref:cingulin n=1 Tax=Callorhinchus milii TaxID=7868 RepID=UPI001C3F96A3|nr:cingulin [Callorhinchus milii]